MLPERRHRLFSVLPQPKNQDSEPELSFDALLELSELPPFASCWAAPAATAATPPATAATPVATRATRFSAPFASPAAFLAVDRTRLATAATPERDFAFRDFAAPPFRPAELRLAAVDLVFDFVFAGRAFAGADLRDLLFFFELLRAAIYGLPIRGGVERIKARSHKAAQANHAE